MSGSGSDRIGSDPRIQINLADILLFDQLFLDHYLIYDPYLSENILQILIYIRSGSTDQVRIGSSSDPDKRIRIQHWICIWTDLRKSGSIGSQATGSGSNPDPDPDLLVLVVSTRYWLISLPCQTAESLRKASSKLAAFDESKNVFARVGCSLDFFCGQSLASINLKFYNKFTGRLFIRSTQATFLTSLWRENQNVWYPRQFWYRVYRE